MDATRVYSKDAEPTCSPVRRQLSFKEFVPQSESKYATDDASIPSGIPVKRQKVESAAYWEAQAEKRRVKEAAGK